MQPIKRITTALGLTLGLFAGLAGCDSLAPTYTQPPMPVSNGWPGTPSSQAATVKPLADVPWQEFYQDDKLQRLIRLALENNRDLRVAALNSERFQALYQIQRSALFPRVDA